MEWFPFDVSDILRQLQSFPFSRISKGILESPQSGDGETDSKIFPIQFVHIVQHHILRQQSVVASGINLESVRAGGDFITERYDWFRMDGKVSLFRHILDLQRKVTVEDD